METTIFIKLCDLVEFRLYKQRRSWGGRLRRIVFVLLPLFIVACVLYLLYGNTNGQLQFTKHALPWLLLWAISWWLLHTVSRFFLRRQIRKKLTADQNQFIMGESRITLSPNGVAIQHPAGPQDCIPWHRIENVLANADYAYLFTSTEYAIILPQRCFADNNYFQAFVRMAVTYHWNREAGDDTLSEPSSPPKSAPTCASAAVQSIPIGMAGLSSESHP